MLKITIVLCYLFLGINEASQGAKLKPNIVLIVADDLGWNDVSFHGSNDIVTPNIDTLAYQSVILQSYYTDSGGTASRSALFTGKYPFRLGTQGASIKSFEDRGIPTKEKLLPEYLKELGYKTQLVGKWDVGKSRPQYLPNRRGFDNFYGFLGSSVDYFTYNAIEKFNNTSYFGLDFFYDEDPMDYEEGHLTHLLTKKAVEVIRDHDKSTPLFLQVSHATPHAGGALVNLQPPEDEALPSNDHIAHSARRLYAHQVQSLDKSIGQIFAALTMYDLPNNTIFIFISDNGGAPEGDTQNFGSNMPLRGMKNTPWEGGVRSTAFLWHPSLDHQIRRDLFHVTDWLPTIVAAAGGNVTNKIDGINQWEAIQNKQKQNKRTNLVITIDDQNGWAAYREDEYKIVIGKLSKDLSGYLGRDYLISRQKPIQYEDALMKTDMPWVLLEPISMDRVRMVRNETSLWKYWKDSNNTKLCVPTLSKGCLYNINEDPLELNDLWHAKPKIIKRLLMRLKKLWSKVRPKPKLMFDERADPAKHDYVWSPWLADNETIVNTDNSAEIQIAVDTSLGTQGASIKSFEDRGIPTKEKLLPEYLKELGYKTQLVGKWDVGKSRPQYLPNRRGFDNFYGFLGSSVDYFTYNAIEKFNNTSYFGLDFFYDEDPMDYEEGHLTHLLTKKAVEVIRDHDKSTPLFLQVSHATPHAGGALVNLQPPEDEALPSNDHIAHSARRLYAHQVQSLDKSIGQIFAALTMYDLPNNTIFIFISDNGGAPEGDTQNFGSNMPLRGMKNTPWEGGVRSTAFLWHPSLDHQIRRDLFHVTDWLPTIVAAAGGNVTNKIDGINQWEAIQNKQKQNKRTNLVITIDDQNGWAAYREDEYKIVIGKLSKDLSGYLGRDYLISRQKPIQYEDALMKTDMPWVLLEPISMDRVRMVRNETSLWKYWKDSNNTKLCVPTLSKGCLYNINEDPLELNDLWHAKPKIIKRLLMRLKKLWSKVRPKPKLMFDERADPAKHDYVWSPWLADNETIVNTDNSAEIQIAVDTSLGFL